MEMECSIHGKTEFVLREGKRYRCKKCAVDAVQKRRRKVKQMAVDYKGKMCEKCGYSKSIAALQFHHIEPGIKSFAIGSFGHCRSWEKIKDELDKCIMICANCHAEIHCND